MALRIDYAIQAYILVMTVIAIIVGLENEREGLLAVSLIAMSPIIIMLAASSKHSKLYLIPGILLLLLWIHSLWGLLH